MGPPGPPEKKKKPSPLETKWKTLRRTLDELQPIWEEHDPGYFMETMRHTQKQADEVTPDGIENYIATQTVTLLNTLVLLDEELLGESGSMTHSRQQTRKCMGDYVGRVRGCVEGQS